MNLRPCEACHRHVQNDVRVCPFCGASLGDTSRAPAFAVAACIGVALVACGCYGPPPHSRGMMPEPPPAVQATEEQPQATPDPQAAASQQFAQPPPAIQATEPRP